MENGPLPAQKHHDAGSLFMPIAVLFPSLQIGAWVIIAEALLVLGETFGAEDELMVEFVRDCPIELVDDLVEAVSLDDQIDDPVLDAVLEDRVDEPVTDASSLDQVTRASVVSAIIAARIDCCVSNQDIPPKSSPIIVAVGTWVFVVEDLVSEVEQAVTVEHESVIMDVDSILAPDSIKIVDNVSQELVILAEQVLLDLLELVELPGLDFAFVDEAAVLDCLVGSVDS